MTTDDMATMRRREPRRAMRSSAVACAIVLASGMTAVSAQRPAPRPSFPGSSPRGLAPDPNVARPIDAADSVFMEELTWIELRDAIRGGKTTAIVAIGGYEQSGPYLVVGKHSYVIRATTEAIARKLGNALVAPTVSFVPEGSFDPPTGFMRYPGAISVEADTFKRLLTDIASSLKVHGFEHIVLISDHGGNTALIKDVVTALTAKWAGGKTAVHYVPEYYDYPELSAWLEAQGIHQVDEGIHDDFGITATMMTIDPDAVRMKQRMAKDNFSINGVPLAPVERTIALGRRVIEFRAAATAEAIRKAIGASR